MPSTLTNKTLFLSTELKISRAQIKLDLNDVVKVLSFEFDCVSPSIESIKTMQKYLELAVKKKKEFFVFLDFSSILFPTPEVIRRQKDFGTEIEKSKMIPRVAVVLKPVLKTIIDNIISDIKKSDYTASKMFNSPEDAWRFLLAPLPAAPTKRVVAAKYKN